VVIGAWPTKPDMAERSNLTDLAIVTGRPLAGALPAAVMGVGTSSTNTFIKDLPLFIAFVLLAIFTFVSGLRAPALIAFIKDTLVYVMVIVAVFLHPDQARRLGAHLRDGADPFRRDQSGDQEAFRRDRRQDHRRQRQAGRR
jgi:hypothetical protein